MSDLESMVEEGWILVGLDFDLAEDILDPAAYELLRPAPGVRGISIEDLGNAAMLISSGAANLITLILSKDAIVDFVQRLFNAMRDRGREELTVSYKTRTGVSSLRLRTTDGRLDLVSLLETFTHQLSRPLDESESTPDSAE